MKFREIYEIWRRDNSLNLALGESYEMLDRTRRMFHESVGLLRNPDTVKMHIDIYQEDRVVNAYQVEVRRRVLRYLAVAGMVNLVPGLVLISIVIDIERIGDYTKNVTELAEAYPGKLDCGAFESRVRSIEQIVEKLFDEVGGVVKASDRSTARRLIDECSRLRQDADRIVEELITKDDESMGRGQTAAVALYVRYLKRIGAHLLNIVSSVASPFERIGFREWDERLLDAATGGETGSRGSGQNL